MDPVETFEFYAEAYHSAARLLFANSSWDEIRRFGSAPVVFLYRHSLELHLKEVLLSGQTILLREGKPFLTAEAIMKSSHQLGVLWDRVKEMYQQIGWEWDQTLDGYGDIITQFATVDKRSDGFRYPVDLSCSSALDLGFTFDLRRFCKVMDVVLRKIDIISCRISQQLDGLDEMACAYQ